MSDPTNALCLSMIFPALPERMKKRVMMDVLSRCGFQVSLKDFAAPRQKTYSVKPILFLKPECRCIYCDASLLSQEKISVEDKAEALRKHLPECLVFRVLKREIFRPEKEAK